MTLTPAFATLLASRRRIFNDRVAAARARTPGFDTAAFSAFLHDCVDPLNAAVVGQQGEAGESFVDAAFDMAVTLVEHGWAGGGARSPVVEKLWRDVAPHLAPAIAAEPRESLGAMTNAAIKVAQEPGTRIDHWLDLMAASGGRARSALDLRRLATIAAWRSGLAQVRDSALDAAAALPAGLARAAVGAVEGDDWAPIASGFAAHRWWAPGVSVPSDGHRIGAFTGLGGRFAQPPEVVASGDTLVVHSAGRHFILVADAYGATLRPVEADDGAPSEQPAAMLRLRGEQLLADDRLVDLDWPAEGLAVAETSDSIAVTSPFSHAVRVFPKAMP